jgi:hypothetical protein
MKIRKRGNNELRNKNKILKMQISKKYERIKENLNEGRKRKTYKNEKEKKNNYRKIENKQRKPDGNTKRNPLKIYNLVVIAPTICRNMMHWFKQNYFRRRILHTSSGKLPALRTPRPPVQRQKLE